MSFLVRKAGGALEPFNPGKLLRSLEKAGADKETAEATLARIEKEYSRRPRGQEILTTHEIYAHAFDHLRARKRPLAARYSLKRALLDLGPSGFPFESYVAELFIHDGYEAKVDQIVQGGCVEHEIDVILTKGEETLYVEAKFHNSLAFKTDLKVALYVKERMDDIVAAGHVGARGLLATNTKFTDKAREYAECSLLMLLSSDYPQGSNLYQRIERAGAFPVTALTSLGRREKTALLEAKIVLCSQILKEPSVLPAAGITGHKAEVILEEAGALCSFETVL